MDAVQNKARSTRKRRGGVTGKGFLPGKSGNPGGRPKGLMNQVRDRTKDGKILIDFAMAVLKGQHGAEVSDQLAAMRFLAERGWGKPAQKIEGGETPIPVEVTLVTQEKRIRDITDILEEAGVFNTEDADDQPRRRAQDS